MKKGRDRKGKREEGEDRRGKRGGRKGGGAGGRHYTVAAVVTLPGGRNGERVRNRERGMVRCRRGAPSPLLSPGEGRAAPELRRLAARSPRHCAEGESLREEDAVELLPVATIANHGGERRGECESRSAPKSYRLGSVVVILPLPVSMTRERDRAEREDSRGSHHGKEFAAASHCFRRRHPPSLLPVAIHK
ncbi:uncharacterized protein DS421_18g622880 [Arachis hypogaea]|nr:uncharacterized protein DS421_18g622880 [Arachis hypogaea]